MFRRKFRITMRKKYNELENHRSLFRDYHIKPVIEGTDEKCKLYMVCTINGNKRRLKDASTADMLMNNESYLDHYAYSLMLE